MRLSEKGPEAVKWTASDIARLIGTFVVLGVVLVLAVPTAAFILGTSSESDLYRIFAFTVTVVVFSTALSGQFLDGTK